MTIRLMRGDLLKQSDVDAVVNTVNCVGVIGKRAADQFKQRYPTMFEDYMGRTDRKAVQYGEPYQYRDLSGEAAVLGINGNQLHKASVAMSPQPIQVEFERGKDAESLATRSA